jgi:hypothetical protein
MRIEKEEEGRRNEVPDAVGRLWRGRGALELVGIMMDPAPMGSPRLRDMCAGCCWCTFWGIRGRCSGAPPPCAPPTFIMIMCCLPHHQPFFFSCFCDSSFLASSTTVVRSRRLAFRCCCCVWGLGRSLSFFSAPFAFAFSFRFASLSLRCRPAGGVLLAGALCVVLEEEEGRREEGEAEGLAGLMLC